MWFKIIQISHRQSHTVIWKYSIDWFSKLYSIFSFWFLPFFFFTRFKFSLISFFQLKRLYEQSFPVISVVCFAVFVARLHIRSVDVLAFLCIDDARKAAEYRIFAGFCMIIHFVYMWHSVLDKSIQYLSSSFFGNFLLVMALAIIFSAIYILPSSFSFSLLHWRFPSHVAAASEDGACAGTARFVTHLKHLAVDFLLLVTDLIRKMLLSWARTFCCDA